MLRFGAWTTPDGVQGVDGGRRADAGAQHAERMRLKAGRR